MRRTQLRAPVAVTCRASPSTPPTLQRPGMTSRRTSSADNSLALRGIFQPSNAAYLPTNPIRIVLDLSGLQRTTL